jgi:hypothetical protein
MDTLSCRSRRECEDSFAQAGSIVLETAQTSSTQRMQSPPQRSRPSALAGRTAAAERSGTRQPAIGRDLDAGRVRPARLVCFGCSTGGVPPVLPAAVRVVTTEGPRGAGRVAAQPRQRLYPDRSGKTFRVYRSSRTSLQRCDATPNPSLELTRYGMRCKPGPRHLVHHRVPGLQRMPPRAAQLER